MDVESQINNELAPKLADAIEHNASDAPHLSTDPDTQKPSVVGDPNKIEEKRGTYKITFAYPADKLTAEDKTRMKKDEKTGYYLAEMTYVDKHIKPLYRGRIVVLLTELTSKLGVIDLGGYTSEFAMESMGKVLLNDTEKIAELARMILGIPEEQVEYMMPYSLAEFFVQIFQNEPNIIGESANFLSRQ